MSRPKRKATEATAMAAKRACGETDLSDGLKWTEVGKDIKGHSPLIVLSSDSLKGCPKIAGFDIDFTVIKTESGRKFATGAKDWTWWDDCVPDKLREIHKNGYRVCFFTNQAGIEKGRVKPREVMTKIEDIIQKLGIPVLAFIATGTNHYRKPSTMMWDYMLENCNQCVKVKLTDCYYIGDAAGRAKDWAPGKPRDFSTGDRMFAANIGIEFKTPDEYFLDEPPAPFEWGSVDPETVMSSAPQSDPGKKHSKPVVLMSRPKRKATEATAMAAKRARGETDLSDGLKWTEVGKDIKGYSPLIVLSSDSLKGCPKIGGFDIDFTVIKTESGRKFATGAKDWTWWDDCVPDKLREIHKNGYRVCFFTNQAGIEKGKVKPQEVMTKIEDIIQKLGIPVLAFIATGTNHYRKPSTMMWDYMLENCNQCVKVKLTDCYYIGDAAGRAKDWAPGKPRDFSTGDRMFAANIGIEFKTPDEYFLDEPPAPFEWGSVDPETVMSSAPQSDPGKKHSKPVVLMSRPKRKATEATAIAAKRARGETDLSDGLKWTEVGKDIKGHSPLIVLSSNSLKGSPKIAGFDIDFTVIKTESGRKFATGAKDWTWWDDCVPDKLREIHKNGYRVCFFTNQAGIEKGRVKPREVMTKIEDIIQKLGIPVLAFIATGTNHYRKPSTMMWDYMLENCNQCVKVKLTDCYYIGDAAGRAKDWAPGKPRDFSTGDRMFAANIGIDFKTPDEYFLDEPPAPFEWGSVDPETVMSNAPQSDPGKKHSKTTELVIMVGPPASGKTTFRKRHLEPFGYVAVNRDTMGTVAKCLKAAKEALKSGTSVVVDNTNPSQSARQDFIDLAKTIGCPCRSFIMNTSWELAHHMNLVRQNQTNGKTRRVPEVGYNVYKKNYQEPTNAEGFSEIVTIDFVPHFASTRDELLFRQWTGGAGQ